MASSAQKRIGARAVRLLCYAIAGLLLAHICAQLFLGSESSISKLLDVNREKNLATAFSAFLLLSCSVLLAQISLLKRGQAFFSHWRGLCGIFLLMTIDESVLLHERLNMFLDERFSTRGIFYYDWVIPACLLLIVLAVVYARFLIQLPKVTRWRFLGAGLLYVSGALGMEMVSGYYIYTHGLSESTLGGHPVLAVLNGIEETAEMVGAVCFLRALLLYKQTETKLAETVQTKVRHTATQPAETSAVKKFY